jgi:hypothetical protein
MLDEEPLKPWTGVALEDGHDAVAPDASGFKVLSDSRITDLRAWNPATAGKVHADSRAYTYRRLTVLKKPEQIGAAFFPVRLILDGAEGQVRFPAGQSLEARVVKTPLKDGQHYRWEAIFDFTKTPAATPTDLLIEVQAPGIFLHGSESTTGMEFDITSETAEFAQWVLMPKGRNYKNYRYLYYKKDQPETVSEKKFYREYLAKDHSILAFKLLALDPGYQHEICWNYE